MEGIVMNTSNITNYKPKDFAELLGVSVKTLQRWDIYNNFCHHGEDTT